jgi:hypothetical protein
MQKHVEKTQIPFMQKKVFYIFICCLKIIIMSIHMSRQI